MIELQGTVLHLTRAYLVVGVIGSPLKGEDGPWMDALMGFVQVDDAGQPAPLPIETLSAGYRRLLARSSRAWPSCCGAPVAGSSR